MLLLKRSPILFFSLQSDINEGKTILITFLIETPQFNFIHEYCHF